MLQRLQPDAKEMAKVLATKQAKVARAVHQYEEMRMSAKLVESIAEKMEGEATRQKRALRLLHKQRYKRLPMWSTAHLLLTAKR